MPAHPAAASLPTSPTPRWPGSSSRKRWNLDGNQTSRRNQGISNSPTASTASWLGRAGASWPSLDAAIGKRARRFVDEVFFATQFLDEDVHTEAKARADRPNATQGLSATVALIDSETNGPRK
jgi:hypothetical protein